MKRSESIKLSNAVLREATDGNSTAKGTIVNAGILSALAYFFGMISRLKHVLFGRALSAISRVVLDRGNDEPDASTFNSRALFRLLLLLLQETAHFHEQPSATGDNAAPLGPCVAFAHCLLALQPLRVPAFAFAWLELASHRFLMPTLLNSRSDGWALFQRLLVGLLRFMEPSLKGAEMSDALKLLYRGTLRVLLVLLHDVPEFLCENHLEICDAIPPTCIQVE